MQGESTLCFGAYALDPTNRQLWRRKRVVTLTGKAFQVLGYLAERSGQLVTKDELFQAVWPQTVVTDSALTVCIKEIRKALHDKATTPRYIETVYRQGYRFIAAVTTTAPHSLESSVQRRESERQGFAFPVPTPDARRQTRDGPLVGRETELAQLHGYLDKALNGERQIVFVSGEPGIGKTTLVDAFLHSLATPSLWIGHGQCIEQYGAGEAYMPMLEALGRLCREPGGERLVALLNQYAPTWLVQMPALLKAADWEALQRKTQHATRERMLREMAEAIEAITAEQPLILVLEDLHWSDAATLELLAVLARRRETARLLILGTYRPVEVVGRGHPLAGILQELDAHTLCRHLPLGCLPIPAIAEYLALRFPGETADRPRFQRLATLLHQRTEGNPLFLVGVVDDLVAQGVLVQRDGKWEICNEEETLTGGVPITIRQVVSRQQDLLRPREQRILEAASVAGMEFSAAAVAAAIIRDVSDVEDRCDALVKQRQFLCRLGISEWPDGTLAARYGFLHALYQQVWHERVSVSRLQRWHQRIGERKEAAYGQSAGDIATELAVHFEQGRDYPRAIHYLRCASENAARRSAQQETIRHLTTALTLLKKLPDSPERTQHELGVHVAIGAPLIATRGYTAPEVETVYARALELCQQLKETPQLFPTLHGLWAFYLTQGNTPQTRKLAEQLLSLAQGAEVPALLVSACHDMGSVEFFLGEFASARAYLERGVAVEDPHWERSFAGNYGSDPRMECRRRTASVLWMLGYPDQALRHSRETLALAQELSHPHSYAVALYNAAWLHQYRRETPETQELAETCIAFSTKHDFAQTLAIGSIFRGWALAEQGQREQGIAQLQQGLHEYQATGAERSQSYFLCLLAEAFGKTGAGDKGMAVLAEALAIVEKNEERFYEAEVYRLKGELTLAQSCVQCRASRVAHTLPPTPATQAEAEAEASFRKAIEIARRQQAKSLELRAVMSLARLWQKQAKKKQARKILAETYNWFTEGFDTQDLQEAKTLIEALA